MSDPNPCLHASYLSLYRGGSRTDPDETVAESQKTRDQLHWQDTPAGTGFLQGHKNKTEYAYLTRMLKK